ncbi:hypothetical protein ABDK00_017010 [Niabella insulamsoli]|uniref:hypothetical protein n=1 Tax=Niabella insulamsoli TaxID=3144874 RepID=UPI0031FD79D3
MEITQKSKDAFVAAAKKLSIAPELPDVSKMRPDLGLYITAVAMLAVILEAEKDGKVHDITNHDVYKYEPLFMAEEGYEAGSSGGGFSFDDFVDGRACSGVGARLSSNSRQECEANAEAYPDLWEIFILNVR